MWREGQGLSKGNHRGKPLGPRLAMPAAEQHLQNYPSDTIRQVVKREVLGPKNEGKLYARPRIFNDLLSSQPRELSCCSWPISVTPTDLNLVGSLWIADGK